MDHLGSRREDLTVGVSLGKVGLYTNVKGTGVVPEGTKTQDGSKTFPNHAEKEVIRTSQILIRERPSGGRCGVGTEHGAHKIETGLH